MAQPVPYSYSGAFLPGTLARAEAEAVEFTAVQAGFQALAVQGVDSGTANTYVVATSGGKSSTYSDGLIVEFKASNANTGACTISVDGGPTVGLTNFSGQSLAAGAISANAWYRALYNSTYSAWTLIAPTSLVTTSNTISNAAPTNKVGLTAAGGVSTACIPIDATFAIDQSIAPTWTGVHTFANSVTFNSSVNFATGLTLFGALNAYALALDGNAATGKSFGLSIAAGTNASDIALLITNTAATAFLEVSGAGSVIVGNPTGGGQGIGTINASGLYINGTAVIAGNSVAGANPSATIGLSAINGTSTSFLRSDGAPALSQAIAPTWTAAHVFAPGSAVTAVTINAPANALGLIINGGTNTANTYVAELISGQGSGFSSGLFIQAGTTSADFPIDVINAAGSHVYFQIKGDGSGQLGYNGSGAVQTWDANGHTTFGAPQAGGQSAFTINGRSGNNVLGVVQAAGTNSAFGVQIKAGTSSNDYCLLAQTQSGTDILRVRGDGAILGQGPTAGVNVDMTPDTGTWVGTFVGIGGVVTNVGTAVWARIGNLVTLLIPTVNSGGTATSNSTSFLMNGLPAAIQPTRSQMCVAWGGCFKDNSSSLNLDSTGVLVSSVNGTLTFMGPIGSGSWTSSGVKNIGTAFPISYFLN